MVSKPFINIGYRVLSRRLVILFLATLSLSEVLSQSMLAVEAQAEPVLSPKPTFLNSIKLSSRDAILVTRFDARANEASSERQLLKWQPDLPLVPASLSKLATSYLAIQKWGLSHRFHTDFYHVGNTLWVRGYGDPMLTSEELDRLAARLKPQLCGAINNIKVDASWFAIEAAPGRTSVSDPYNAPLSAVSANFNTVYLQKLSGKVLSAEAQTPITPLARSLSSRMRLNKERINLETSNNAQRYFAELLAAKLGLGELDIEINQSFAGDVKPLYRHSNQNLLDKVLAGALLYSNNFIANQVFLNLAEQPGRSQTNFMAAQQWAETALKSHFEWASFSIEEGAGLSRKNRLSARQIDDVLRALEPNMALLEKVKHADRNVIVHAKTGTLDGVRSYAGFIEFKNTQPRVQYRFVFMFNRKVPYRFRETTLDTLIKELQQYHASNP